MRSLRPHASPASLAAAAFIVTLVPTARGQQPSAAAPLRLVDLLDSVRLHHPLIAAAQARVRAALGSRTTAGAFGNPVLGYEVQGATLPGQQVPMDRQAMATATIPLESFYQRSARVRRADADVRAASADARATDQQLALDAARAFYGLALAQVRDDVAHNVVAWLDSVVAYNRTRVEEGVTAEADLIRSQLERDRAAADVAMQEAELARARAELSAFVGDPVNNAPPLAVSVESAPMLVPSAFASGRDVTTRPQVVAARERVTAAGAAMTTERTMIVRELGATLGTMQSGGTTSLVAGVSLPVPLFNQNRGEIARASAERDAANYQLVATERSARAELTGAYDAARILADQAIALGKPGADGAPAFLARADEARRIALGAYREGAVPLLTVLDAVRAWGDARITFYQTLFTQHESMLTLLTAEGADLSAALAGRSVGGGR